jgi:hypothetical protein
MGYTAVAMFRNERYRKLLYVSLIIILLHDSILMREAVKIKNNYEAIGSYVNRYTDKNDLIIIGKDSPELLYTCDRKGWRLYGDILTAENVARLVDEGAKYFVPASLQMDTDADIFLDKNYEKITFDDGYYIYRLKP